MPRPLSSQAEDEPGPAAGWHGFVGSPWLPPTLLLSISETHTAENHVPSPPGDAAAGGTQGGTVVWWLDIPSWNEAGLGPHPSVALPSHEPRASHSASQSLRLPPAKLGK